MTNTGERWTDKVALVTGASTGIGRAICEELVTKGMKVVGLALTTDKMKTMADEMKTKTGKLYPLQCDLSNQNEIMRSMEWIEKNLGCVDILVNNAALNTPTTMIEGGMEEWKKTMDVNVIGLTCITKETLKLMKRKGMNTGCIINVSDTCGLKLPVTLDRPMCGPYMASKRALEGITDCLRFELAQTNSNIKVMSICPGLVETEMTTMTLKEKPRLALKPKNIADTIWFMMCCPDTVLIQQVVITPMREIM